MPILCNYVRRLMPALAFFVAYIVTPAEAQFGSGSTDYIDYAPASAFIAHGQIQIGSFVYLPAMSGKMKPNEFYYRAWAERYADQNIDTFVRDALFKEFRFVGFDVAHGGPVLTGEIEDFALDGNSYGAMDITIHYTMRDTQGVVLYDAKKATHQKYGGGNVSPVDNGLTSNFQALMSDPLFIAALGISAGVEPRGQAGSSTEIEYVPSSPLITGGAVRVGAFEYLPPKSGKVTADQVRNTAIGNIHIGRSIGDYYSEALLKEFRLTGVDVASADRVLTGTIVDLYVDDLGDTCDWTLDVKYMVTDSTGNILYQQERNIKKRTAKWLGTLNAVIQYTAETLLTDPDFLKAINAPQDLNNVVSFHEFDHVYPPMSALTVHGSVQVGPFTYLPSTVGVGGKKMAIDQIANEALLRGLHLDGPVDKFFHDAILQELRVVGIDVRGKQLTLTGEIQEFHVDDVASTSELAITVRYIVSDNAGNVLYDSTKTSHPHSGANNAYYHKLKINIEALITDPEFIKAIN